MKNRSIKIIQSTTFYLIIQNSWKNYSYQNEQKKERKKEIINNSDHKHSTVIARSCYCNRQHIRLIIAIEFSFFSPPNILIIAIKIRIFSINS